MIAARWIALPTIRLLSLSAFAFVYPALPHPVMWLPEDDPPGNTFNGAKTSACHKNPSLPRVGSDPNGRLAKSASPTTSPCEAIPEMPCTQLTFPEVNGTTVYAMAPRGAPSTASTNARTHPNARRTGTRPRSATAPIATDRVRDWSRAAGPPASKS